MSFRSLFKIPLVALASILASAATAQPTRADFSEQLFIVEERQKLEQAFELYLLMLEFEDPRGLALSLMIKKRLEHALTLYPRFDPHFLPLRLAAEYLYGLCTISEASFYLEYTYHAKYPEELKRMGLEALAEAEESFYSGLPPQETLADELKWNTDQLSQIRANLEHALQSLEPTAENRPYLNGTTEIMLLEAEIIAIQMGESQLELEPDELFDMADALKQVIKILDPSA